MLEFLEHYQKSVLKLVIFPTCHFQKYQKCSNSQNLCWIWIVYILENPFFLDSGDHDTWSFIEKVVIKFETNLVWKILLAKFILGRTSTGFVFAYSRYAHFLTGRQFGPI